MVAGQLAADRRTPFQSEIRIYVSNRMGVLAALSAALASTQTNISQVQVEQRDAETLGISFVLDVRIASIWPVSSVLCAA